MIDGLSMTIGALSLALAVWAFVECGRHRAPTRPLLGALGAIGVLMAVVAIVVAVRLAGGSGPRGDTMITLIGYLLTALLLPPAGIVLARMEPTRWGSAIVGAAAVVVPVLLLRLEQIWHG